MRIPKGNGKLDRKDSLYRIEKARWELTGNILGLSLENKQFKNFGWVFTTTGDQSTCRFLFLRIVFRSK